MSIIANALNLSVSGLSSNIASGSAVTATSNAATDVTSFSLTQGTWLCGGNITWPSLGTVPTSVSAWISTTSATLPNSSLYSTETGNLLSNTGSNAPGRIFAVGGGGETLYLSGLLSNTSGNGTQCGYLWAIKIVP